ncbi:MAG: hypothetical protein NTY36_06290 [Deltaproteobacteria bacterium]|nr:hypothetical protein [Deltaproteobacteria bacterium]
MLAQGYSWFFKSVKGIYTLGGSKRQINWPHWPGAAIINIIAFLAFRKSSAGGSAGDKKQGRRRPCFPGGFKKKG